jgi:hypothetical protein
MSALRIHHEHLPVQIKKHIERRIARHHHDAGL